ncbi:MAG: hypothetical protein J6J27_04940, partial [Alphaproteobacteria bacterium]|nr:hypothetical protein [Alphaproteobacteria bacterium]
NAGSILKIEDIDIEIFDINSVKYEAKSVIVPVVIMVALVAAAAAVIVVLALKKREYDDV